MNKFLTDDTGHKSIMRLVWAFTVIIYMGTWCYTCLANNQMIPFSAVDIGFIGMLFSSKIGQKYVENNGKKTGTPTN